MLYLTLPGEVASAIHASFSLNASTTARPLPVLTPAQASSHVNDPAEPLAELHIDAPVISGAGLTALLTNDLHRQVYALQWGPVDWHEGGSWG